MELLRTNPGLRSLDHTMFEDLPDAGVPVDPRDEFYVCNGLIQLIENVYADLDLEHLWMHPHVQGWMNVFRRWAQQPAFRNTWRISEQTYAERFRNFYNDRLRGRPIALPRGFVASHRGLSTPRGHEENTVDACKNTIRQGASVVELDVRKLARGIRRRSSLSRIGPDFSPALWWFVPRLPADCVGGSWAALQR
jgi:hypothetical protein